MNDMLRAGLLKIAKLRTTEYVIEHGGQSISSIRTGFAASVRRARLENVTPHVLRHTAATWMVMGSVRYKMIGKFLGCNAAVVEKIYGHHSLDWLKQATDALTSGWST